MVKFEERLWGIIRNFVTLGRDNPAMLVNAVRIVELQEMVDAQLDATANRTSRLLPQCLLNRVHVACSKLRSCALSC